MYPSSPLFHIQNYSHTRCIIIILRLIRNRNWYPLSFLCSEGNFFSVALSLNWSSISQVIQCGTSPLPWPWLSLSTACPVDSPLSRSSFKHTRNGCPLFVLFSMVRLKQCWLDSNILKHLSGSDSAQSVSLKCDRNGKASSHFSRHTNFSSPLTQNIAFKCNSRSTAKLPQYGLNRALS